MKLMLITGANGQIGSYLAHAYRDQYELALLYHNRAERLGNFEPNMLFKVDLENTEQVSSTIAHIAEQYKQAPAILIHCAAKRSADAMPLANTEPDTFKDVFNSNFMGAYNILRYTLSFMQENRFGRVVMFGSDVSRSGLPRGSAYAAAKAGIVNLVKSVAREMATYNVLLNAISPAPVDTILEEDYQGEYLRFRQEYFARHISNVPSGKLVSQVEIKRVVDLMISAEVENMNGEEIFLTGGLQ
ncbi:MAG: SDR family oxidoreductase [Candidatus Cloacimonas sp.]|jgi:NAD(P)-dependent dehydrogenase (short-subunit alcohol dehydrogenase family)|nr:SDR family oxidoreductase [Candidatus Cloacimonas sp.]